MSGQAHPRGREARAVLEDIDVKVRGSCFKEDDSSGA